jgi:flagellar basal body rod protein FlgB
MLHSHEEKVLNTLISAVGDRQQILANNLTNVNTPGYIRQDLDFGQVMKGLQHEGPNKDIDGIINKAIYQDTNNKSSYEKELAEMAENHLKYVLLTRINGHIYKHMEEATQSARAA